MNSLLNISVSRRLVRGVLFVVFSLLAPGGIQAGMVNRWSFNNAAGNAVAGSTVVDSISGKVGVVRGIGATFTGTQLLLPGTTTGNQTPTTISAYLDLPNGLISNKTNLTIEFWADVKTAKSWQRFFDFGRVVGAGDGLGATGEITGSAPAAPGATKASDELFLAANGTNAAKTQRLASRINFDGTNGVEFTNDASLAITAGTSYHYAVTFQDGVGAYGASGGTISWYRNGAFVGSVDVNYHLVNIEDVNNWLGRSQWTGDSMANIAYDEFRIYDYALSVAQLASSYAAGPNAVIAPPVVLADSVTMNPGQKVRIPVLANDTGSINPATIVVVQAPQFGSAVPDSTGKILYTHRTGSPASDQFTYKVSGEGGQSSAATVTVKFSGSLRLANNSPNVPSAPPPLATQLTQAFTGVTAPVCLASPLNDGLRLFVCEKGGVLKVIPDVTASMPTVSTVLTISAATGGLLNGRTPAEALSTSSEQGLLGLAFHPNFATNGYIFIYYSVTLSGTTYERLSRVTLNNPNSPAPTASMGSEVVLIQQVDTAPNHNAGDLHFGADGYLYVSLGDGGDQNDTQNHAQHIDQDFYSGILRIDVDKKAGNLEPANHASVPKSGTPPLAQYSVPADNPFVGATTFNGAAINTSTLRTEFWAVGFRNPWRFSFDPQTGEMWIGDVGQDTYEEVDLGAKGANYGWSFREANHNGPKSASAPANFDTLYHTPPVYEFPHAGSDSTKNGSSVIGGVVYRGTRYPTLAGAYIFGDYVSGNIWSLVLNGTGAPTVTRIAGAVGISAFGIDPSNGDVLIADYSNNRILRLTVETVTASFPATLSETGLFADLADATALWPSPGVLPYAPNLPFWSDYAVKSRWFTIPDGTSTIAWSRDGAWTFPSGQIWIKHFDMEMTRGNSATRKRIETRLIVKNASGAYGVSYRWNDAGTEAALVADSGADFDLNITVNGSVTTQRWHIPSRAECLACHTPQAGHALSFNTRQLNLTNTINGSTGNQLTLLQNAGYFSNSPGSPNLLPRHIRPDESSYPVEARVRSYLAVNCSYCHQAGGTAAPAAWNGRPELTLDQTGLINGSASNNGGSAVNKLIVPGDTTHSIVLNRMAVANGFTRMPPLASSQLDQTDIALVTDWITNSLPSRQTYADWRVANFSSATSPQGDPATDPDGDGASNTTEYLAGTLPLSGGSFFKPQVAVANGNATVTFSVPANRSATVETSTDLINWSAWDVPGNAGLPTAGGMVTLVGQSLGPRQFFRVKLSGN